VHRIVSKHHEALVGVRGIEDENWPGRLPRPCGDVLSDDVHDVGQAPPRYDLDAPTGMETFRRQHEAVTQISHAA
jgi:hypothetical protein